VVVSSRFVDAGGIRLHTIAAGTGGDPIVLLHGLGSTVTKWRDVLPILGARRRTIAIDLPGFGQSDAPRARYTFGFLAGAVRAGLEALGVKRCVLVGNSLGGVTAMWLAATWPDLVSAQVLVSPALPLPPAVRPNPQTIARMIASSVPGVGEMLYTAAVRRWTPERLVADGLARNVVDATRVSAETLALLHEEAAARKHRPEQRRSLMSAQRHLMWMLTARRADVQRTAARLQLPTLLLWGDKDRLVPLAVGEDWVRRIPGAELVVMEGAGHNPQLEMPDRFSEIVLAFAERSAGEGTISSPVGTPESRG
jgi:pimeloyl-ACP methyl ester carboxylesterase